MANIGGGLTPLGAPPLFLGFLKGVDFFWTAKQMLPPVLITSLALLALFYVVDCHYYKKEDELLPIDPTADSAITTRGKFNFQCCCWA